MSKSYEIAGKPLRCAHCGHDRFEMRNILLNTRGAAFFNFDWANRTASTLTCASCSRIEWFAGEPKETS